MRKHISLIVGLAIPVLLVIAVIVSIYLPRAYTKSPKTNFLFINNNYTYSASYPQRNPVTGELEPVKNYYHYSVDGSRITLVPGVDASGRGYEKQNLPPVYLFDVAKNTYAVVPTEKIGEYTVSPTKTSPDGFTLSQGSGGGGLFFGIFGVTGDYSSYYLTKNSYSQKIDLPTGIYLRTDYCYSGLDCGFIGWVTGGPTRE